LRDLLESRAQAPEAAGLPAGDEIDGRPAVLVWPPRSLWLTLTKIAPFCFPIDADTRAELLDSVQLLAEFLRAEGLYGSAEVARADKKLTMEALRNDDIAEAMAEPWSWSQNLRRVWLKTERKFEPPAADGESWQARFFAMPWERRDALVGPIPRAQFTVPSGLWDAPAPVARVALTSTLVAAARTAPLVTAVLEVAEFLADRPGIWSGGRLADTVVRQVIAGTSLTDPEAVQEAWRLAVLDGYLWPTPARVFRGEKVDDWADDDQVVERWVRLVEAVIRDVSDPVRDRLVWLVPAAYAPGVEETSVPALVVLDAPEGRVAVDRLRRLGALDGFALTPLGRQGLLFDWTGWKADDQVLEPGAWRPDLGTADIVQWVRARNLGLIDATGAAWITQADRQAFAGQLVDVMRTARDDRVLRASAYSALLQLGSGVAAAVDRFAGTPLDAYSRLWPYRELTTLPAADSAVSFVTDYLALIDEWVSIADSFEPGMNTALGVTDWFGSDRFEDRGQRFTADTLARLRSELADQRTDTQAMLDDLTSPVA
jgi:hypothetical protein